MQLVLTGMVIGLFLCLSIKKIVNILKTDHPESYEKLSYDSFMPMQNGRVVSVLKLYSFIFGSKHKNLKDESLSDYCNITMILFVLFIAVYISSVAIFFRG